MVSAAIRLRAPGRLTRGFMMTFQRLTALRDLEKFGARRIDISKLVLFTALFAIFEGMGIGVLLPILSYAEKGGTIDNSALWKAVTSLLHFFGLWGHRYEFIILIVLAFSCLFIRSFLNYVRDISAAKLKLKMAGNVRKMAVDAIARGDLHFYDSHDKGMLLSVLTLEADRTSDAMAARIGFITGLSLLLIYVALLFLLSPALALYASPVLILLGLVFRWQGITVRRLSGEVSENNIRFGEQLNDRLSGIQRIKMRGEEARTIASLRRTIETIIKSMYGIEKIRLLVEIGMQPVLVIVVLYVLYIAVDHLNMSMAGLGLFMFIIVRLVPQVTLMNSMWAYMHGCTASLHRVDALIEEASRRREQSHGGLVLHRLRSDIGFEHVHFRYPGTFSSGYQIKDVSFEIPRGALTAVVGRSGAGKSTLVKLLVGFYQPQSGEIMIDGAPMKRYDLIALRRKMALVPQEPFLFNDTVRNNLNFGLTPPLQDEELQAILNKSHCSDFVDKLENGLDTVVGERGARLSQGQRQRLAIAHALAVKAEILVLDEPTSALDSESEQAIQDTLTKGHGEMTIIVIAHRLSTIRHADQILLMDDGIISARGSHDELIETSPLYRKLFEIQMIP
jgi:ATP-binding cassette, subfamily B, bacterial MsbA